MVISTVHTAHNEMSFLFKKHACVNIAYLLRVDAFLKQRADLALKGSRLVFIKIISRSW